MRSEIDVTRSAGGVGLRLRALRAGQVFALCGAVSAWACAPAPGASGAPPAPPPTADVSLAALPPLPADALLPSAGDWLVAPPERRTGVYRQAGRTSRHETVVMSNGLISRTWRIAPNGGTIAFDNLVTRQSLLRAVTPEAIVTIDGRRYDVGGLVGQPDRAYLTPEWAEALTADPAALVLADVRAGDTEPRLAWKRTRHAADAPWPPPGAGVTFAYGPPPSPAEDHGLAGIRVDVHYEMYDGIPLLCKWITVHNGADRPITLNSFVSEILACVEGESLVEDPPAWRLPPLHVESDYSMFGVDRETKLGTTRWLPDPHYETQVNYRLTTPCLLHSRPPIGPEQLIPPGGSFQSFRTFVLVQDSSERERQGLAVRRMYRTVAPWVTENPIMMHCRSADPAAVRLAIDQCAEVGFEMLILTFGSGFNMEDRSAANLARARELADYAKSRGVEIGGYSLLASRSIGPETDVIHPQTGQPGGAIFGQSPCLGSAWGQAHFEALRAFFEQTGFALLEHDGSYPGDLCAATSHPGHRGLNDSQWTQWRAITDFYQWCRANGVFLNVPDYYHLAGSNKTGMGYRETNWSLPRAQQVIHARQNIYDGTWTKTPSMGWMFVPLTEYHGGGAAATIEPLHEHLAEYELLLATNFGSGVQACYRGPRLYDTEQTKAVVRKWVSFFKRHRAILESDLIHVRRADGRDLDCLLHVNPRLPEKGLAMVFNPLDQPVKRTLPLPLYYTGLTEIARIRVQEGEPAEYRLNRRYEVDLPVDLAPRGVTWFVVQSP